jgi:hypothetical protein
MKSISSNLNMMANCPISEHNQGVSKCLDYYISHEIDKVMFQLNFQSTKSKNKSSNSPQNIDSSSPGTSIEAEAANSGLKNTVCVIQTDFLSPSSKSLTNSPTDRSISPKSYSRDSTPYFMSTPSIPYHPNPSELSSLPVFHSQVDVEEFSLAVFHVLPERYFRSEF